MADGSLIAAALNQGKHLKRWPPRNRPGLGAKVEVKRGKRIGRLSVPIKEQIKHDVKVEFWGHEVGRPSPYCHPRGVSLTYAILKYRLK